MENNDMKTSQMPDGGAVSGNELLPAVKEGRNVRITTGAIITKTTNSLNGKFAAKLDGSVWTGWTAQCGVDSIYIDNDGNIVGNASYECSGYIPLNTDYPVVLTCQRMVDTTVCPIAIFDSEFRFLPCTAVYAKDRYTVSNYPAGAAYFIVCALKNTKREYTNAPTREAQLYGIARVMSQSLSGKVDKVSGKGLSTEDFTPALKKKLKALENYDDTELRTLMDDAWFECLARQFEALAGNRGSVDRAAMTFSLHGVTAISATEMFRIIAAPWNSGGNYYNPGVRTAAIWRGFNYGPAKNLIGVFYNNGIIETVENFGIQIDKLDRCFRNCAKLRAICALTDPMQANWVSDFSSSFQQLPLLEYVGISIGNCTGLAFPDSPLLSLKCLSDIVARATNTRPVSIGVHADVYAKLIGDTDNEAVASMTAEERQSWMDVLTAAEAKSIVFLPPCKRLSFYGGVKVLTPTEFVNIPAYGHRENWHNWIKDDNVAAGDTVLIDTRNSATGESGYVVGRLMGFYDETGGGYHTPYWINTFSFHGAAIEVPGVAKAANALAADFAGEDDVTPDDDVASDGEELTPSADHDPADETGNVITQ